MEKEGTWPLAPAIRMLWETAVKTWRQTFALIVAVKRCGRFIITGKSVLFRVMPLWGIDAVTIRLSMFFPRDAPVGHRRGNNPVEYVFFIFVTRSHKKQCRILIEV